MQAPTHDNPPQPSRRTLLRLGAASALSANAWLTACGGSDSPTPTPAAPLRTTVLVYLLGSDLESRWGMGTANLVEMMAAGANPNVNLIVTTGGANKDGWRTVKRWLIKPGQQIELSDEGARNMGLADTLRDFIVWGRTNYPADRYVLDLWDHGGGPLGGFGPDELYGEDGRMSIQQLGAALSAAQDLLPAHARAPFELIAFDACLMASVEVAQALAPYARYLGASEETEPGEGWDYVALLDFLRDHPNATGAELGRTIADSFVAKSAKLGRGDATFSVTDLARVGPLVQALEQLAAQQLSQLRGAQPLNAWINSNRARRQAVDFQTVLFGNGGRYDLVDLASLVGQPLYNSAPAGQSVLQALQQAVVHRSAGAEFANLGLGGLTLYLNSKRALGSRYGALPWSQTMKDWMQQQQQVAEALLPMPKLGPPQWNGGAIWSSIDTPFFEAAMLAVMRSDANLAYATKPALVSGQNNVPVAIGGNPAEGWPLLDGRPVVVLQDQLQAAADRALYAIPVMALHRADAVAGGRAVVGPGYLMVGWNKDVHGRESWRVERFEVHMQGMEDGRRPYAALKPGDLVYPRQLDLRTGEVTTDVRTSKIDWTQAITIPAEFGSPGGWNLALGPLPAGYATSMRLIAADLTGSPVSSSAVNWSS